VTDDARQGKRRSGARWSAGGGSLSRPQGDRAEGACRAAGEPRCGAPREEAAGAEEWIARVARGGQAEEGACRGRGRGSGTEPIAAGKGLSGQCLRPRQGRRHRAAVAGQGTAAEFAAAA
jgi:hypothetical protein